MNKGERILNIVMMLIMSGVIVATLIDIVITLLF